MQNLCSFEITTNDKSHDLPADYHDLLAVFSTLYSSDTNCFDSLKAGGEVGQILSFLLTLSYLLSGSTTAVTE